MSLVRSAARNVRRERPEVIDPVSPSVLLQKALTVARTPEAMSTVAPGQRQLVDQMVKAVQAGSSWTRAATPHMHMTNKRPISADVVAQRAARALGPASSVTPVDIEQAMRMQGLDWVEPFSPGSPLTPYYGYSRRPRLRDYQVGRNITTQTRIDRIPFATLKRLYDSYDVAQICVRHAIQSMRSMRIRFEAMDGYEDNPVKEIAEAKRFLRRPDGRRTFRNWMSAHQMDLWRYDAATLYRTRGTTRGEQAAGKLKRLLVVDGSTVAPMLDYFGDNPVGDAPAFQQFIQGIPWDWLKWEDLIYQPFWPVPENPYGTPPLETVLINANTDIRLQAYFLQFFTTGQVPEAFAIAPEGESDPDSLAEWQETYDDWTYGDQSERWGLRWLPHGTELEFYKPQQFDPDIAEYVMRRTVAAFGQTPHDLGFTDDVNRAAGTTQMDVQFRISTLPFAGYYEDLLDGVLQTDLSLPVQVRFDTGREKEDRLMEAQAHYYYVQMGAESADEVREKVLGYPINPEEKLPRGIMDQRLGWIPAAHLIAVAGDVDPLTGVPKPGTVDPVPYTLPGGPAPAEGPQGGQPQPAAGAGPKGGTDPTKAYPRPLSAHRQASGAGSSAQPSAPHSGPAVSAHPGEGPGYGTAGLERNQARKELTTGAGIAGSPLDEGDEERDDLDRWRRNARKAVARGSRPRAFVDSAIRPLVWEAVWSHLEKATTREEVDAAFAKAKGPLAGGIVVQAADTGRVLLVQRTPDKHDPAEAYARWEFPGGKLTGDDPWTGAKREWEEETGAALPESAEHVGNWASPDGVYVGYVLSVPSEADVVLKPQREEVSEARWWDKDALDDPEVRDKVTQTLTRVTPLLKGWTAQPRNRRGQFSTANAVGLEDFHRHTDRIVEHYTPLIQRAMAERLTRRAVMEVARRHIGSVAKAATTTPRRAPFAPVTPAAAGMVAGAGATAAVGAGLAAAGASTAFASLRATGTGASTAVVVSILGALYADAYLQGAHEAAEASDGSMPPWTVALDLPGAYWDHWEPGVAERAQSVAGGGLAKLLADADVVIKGIDHTQLERIAHAIDEGAKRGFPVAEVEREIAEIIDTATRAKMIAETEYARAMGAAAMETYVRNGVPEVKWLHEPGACARCMENVAASPQPARNPRWPQGPIPVHPTTRCAVAPTFGSLTGGRR